MESSSPSADERGWLDVFYQKTIKKPICCQGIGLHTGRMISVTLEPADVDCGVVFIRSDLGGQAIPARYDCVVDTRLSTVVAAPSQARARVATIEHLMAALSGVGVDNVTITLDGPEVPVFDGSSADFAFLLRCAGIQKQAKKRRTIEILKPVRVENGDAFAELRPRQHGGLSLSMSISFAARPIGQQAFTMVLNEQNFRQDLEKCRTFVMEQEIEHLRQAGLALGGSLDNAIVVGDDRIINPTGLRHPDEFVRHKMLDAVGDLALAGGWLQASFIGHKSGHALNNRLLRAVFADKAAWRYQGAGRQKASSLIAA